MVVTIFALSPEFCFHALMSKELAQNTFPLVNAEFLHSLGALLGSTAMVGVKDKKFRYIYANNSYEALFRTDPGAMIGHHNQELGYQGSCR